MAIDLDVVGEPWREDRDAMDVQDVEVWKLDETLEARPGE